MSENINVSQIQFKRTKKAINDSVVSDYQLLPGEPLVSPGNRYMLVGKFQDSQFDDAVFIAGVPVPYLSQTEFFYDGNAHSAQVMGMNEDFCEIDDNTDTDKVDAGEYKVTVRLKNGYSWNTNDTTDKVLKWRIVDSIGNASAGSANRLSNPVWINGMQFDGSSQLKQYVQISQNNQQITFSGSTPVLDSNGIFYAATTLFLGSTSTLSDLDGIRFQYQGKTYYLYQGTSLVTSMSAGQIYCILFAGTSGGKNIFRLVGSSQISISNDRSGTSQSKVASEALANMNSKTFVQASTPTNQMKSGDLWFNTGNQRLSVYVDSSTGWKEVKSDSTAVWQ